MNRILYWGLGILIILFIVAGGFVFYQQRTEQENEKSEQSGTEVVKPPPSGASPHGDWHGDEWHDASHTPIIAVSQFVEPETPDEYQGNRHLYIPNIVYEATDNGISVPILPSALQQNLIIFQMNNHRRQIRVS